MLQDEAKQHPKKVQVLDLDQTVSPGNHYDADVNGQVCRFDGVHFSAYCSELARADGARRGAQDARAR